MSAFRVFPVIRRLCILRVWTLEFLWLAAPKSDGGGMLIGGAWNFFPAFRSLPPFLLTPSAGFRSCR
jgi:hypothetical protein